MFLPHLGATSFTSNLLSDLPFRSDQSPQSDSSSSAAI